MKVLSTAGLTKLIELIKSSFISVDDTETTTEIDTETTSEVTLSTVATSGSYNDLSNKPNIPTATSDLTNDSGFITGISSLDVTTALGYTPVGQADLATLLAGIYPVGSIYIGTQSTCPMATLISGSTWELVAQDRALWGSDGTNANTTIAAGLPNIAGSGYWIHSRVEGGYTGPFYINRNDGGDYNLNQNVISNGGEDYSPVHFDASRANSTYGNSSTVQPPAYRVNIWRRTA